MDLKGSETEQNIHKVFEHEMSAYFEYMFAAKAASDAGFALVADMFHQTARNEAEHAEHAFNLLGGAGDIKANIRQAIEHEEEATAFYQKTADVAEAEGFGEVAALFRRVRKGEENHKTKFQELLQSLDQSTPFEGRTVRHSALTMAQLMLPAQANSAGFVHGGELMKLMDSAAGVTAGRHSNSYVVTAQVNDIRFLQPVRVGTLVLVNTKITFVGRTSMEIQIDVHTEDLSSGERTKALTAYFTMVAVDGEGRPKPVPPLIVYTEEEEKLFREGQQRYNARKERQGKEAI
jgi:acyl-CoA hydrolase/bacterioferritin (cytochrome b1)